MWCVCVLPHICVFDGSLSLIWTSRAAQHTSHIALCALADDKHTVVETRIYTHMMRVNIYIYAYKRDRWWWLFVNRVRHTANYTYRGHIVYYLSNICERARRVSKHQLLFSVQPFVGCCAIWLWCRCCVGPCVVCRLALRSDDAYRVRDELRLGWSLMMDKREVYTGRLYGCTNYCWIWSSTITVMLFIYVIDLECVLRFKNYV